MKRLSVLVIFCITFLHLNAQKILIDSSILMDFSGEPVPKSDSIFKNRYNWERRILDNQKSHLKLNLLVRSRSFFPVASAILSHFEIPDDFKFLLFAESYLHNGRSKKGALGYWQIMDKTARDYGLSINMGKDDRLSFLKSTNMACWYLKSLYHTFGSWTLAAAAYNEGPGRLKRDLSRNKGKNYYDLNLNPETSRYIFKILAIKYYYYSL